MRLLFVVDGRSPIALNWICYFINNGDEVHLVSTFPCQPEAGLASFEFIPVAFSGIKSNNIASKIISKRVDLPHGDRGFSGFVPLRLRTALRQWLGLLTIPEAARRLAIIVDRIKPDIVHAMRIPFEGMLATRADLRTPLLISVWGNDFTLHARSNPWMAAYTRQALRGTTSLHTDCRRDLHLAQKWGFASNKPSIVLPGAGGVQLDVFYPPSERNAMPVIINPRGFRAYLRSDTFFRAIPLVQAKLPRARFVCPGMAGEPEAQRWLGKTRMYEAVELLPLQSREQMADLFRMAQVAVSPSTHDGTPNTLLEAMACACFPIAGDIESLREWIIPGENGLLVNPGDATALAEAILQAYSDSELLQRASEINLGLIKGRAEYKTVMGRAGEFYKNLVI
jgi:glycosyltransferase involved in cell wall biosynthesis